MNLSVANPEPQLRDRLGAWLRRDGLAVLLFALAVVVMTYPMAFRPAAGWPRPESGPGCEDLFTALWQKWWLGKVVADGHNANFTPYLFYPNGLDVTFQPHPWTALGTWRLLASLFGDAAGHNLNVMLGLLASAFTAYLLIRHLTGSRIAAWVGGAFFAFYPGHIVRAHCQPTTGNIQWIPLFMLALDAGLHTVARSSEPRRAFSRRGLALLVLAALALSLNAYISIKPWIQAALLGALYTPLAALANGWWRRAAFWRALAVLAVCSLVLVLPVLSPYLRAGPGLQHAIEQTEDDTARKSADLLSYVEAAPNLPLFMPLRLGQVIGIPSKQWIRGPLYLGLVSVALTIFGLVLLVRQDRRRLVWLAMALVFWSLSLGEVLWIGETQYPGVWMPYRLVANNPVFEAIRVPERFALSFSLAWAVLVAYGVVYLERRLNERRWIAIALIGCLVTLMLFELSVPVSVSPPNEVSPFYDRLQTEAERGAIIDLPMGRAGSKLSMYLQTVHERPIVEGRIARMPEGAYDYIDSNPLLRAWRKKEPLGCGYDMEHALSDLQADGFRYVIVHTHKGPVPEWMVDYFVTVEPIYQDDWVTVFTLTDLQANPPCTPSHRDES